MRQINSNRQYPDVPIYSRLWFTGMDYHLMCNRLLDTHTVFISDVPRAVTIPSREERAFYLKRCSLMGAFSSFLIIRNISINHPTEH